MAGMRLYGYICPECGTWTENEPECPMSHETDPVACLPFYVAEAVPVMSGAATADSIMHRHLDHYRSRDCLAESAICCDANCPCHPAPTDSDGVHLASYPPPVGNWPETARPCYVSGNGLFVCRSTLCYHVEHVI